MLSRTPAIAGLVLGVVICAILARCEGVMRALAGGSHAPRSLVTVIGLASQFR